MADLKNVTLQLLRDLAKKHLPEDKLKLRSKEELFAALKKAAPAAVRNLVDKGSAVAKSATEKVKKVKAAAAKTTKAPKPRSAAKPKATKPEPKAAKATKESTL